MEWHYLWHYLYDVSPMRVAAVPRNKSQGHFHRLRCVAYSVQVYCVHWEAIHWCLFPHILKRDIFACGNNRHRLIVLCTYIAVPTHAQTYRHKHTTPHTSTHVKIAKHAHAHARIHGSPQKEGERISTVEARNCTVLLFCLYFVCWVLCVCIDVAHHSFAIHCILTYVSFVHESATVAVQQQYRCANTVSCGEWSGSQWLQSCHGDPQLLSVLHDLASMNV